VTGEFDEQAAAGDELPDRRGLHAVRGPIEGSAGRPVVRLRREWKGLTVADLLRDEVLERLPGQVQSALQHIERGEWAAADRSLPGEHGPILVGPGHRRHARRGWVAAVAIAATLAAVVLWLWWFV
jgi:hypothetical protein